MSEATRIATVKAGRHYRATMEGTRYTFMLTDRTAGEYVQIYSANASHGLFSIERFGNELSPAGIRTFAASLKGTEE